MLKGSAGPQLWRRRDRQGIARPDFRPTCGL